jgi:hypothetical protein
VPALFMFGLTIRAIALPQQASVISGLTDGCAERWKSIFSATHRVENNAYAHSISPHYLCVSVR